MMILHHSQLLSSRINPIIITSSSNANANTNSNKREIEIRVCTNRTCRRQGSFETLETLVGLSPPNISVKPCGCLGRCGSGPNLVVLPDAVIVSHCATPTQAARLIAHFSPQLQNDDDAVTRSLDSLAFRNKAEIEFHRGNSSLAEAFFTQAIEAKPIGGIHVAYKGRSAVRLALGNWVGALEDSKEALAWHPQYAEVERQDRGEQKRRRLVAAKFVELICGENEQVLGIRGVYSGALDYKREVEIKL